MSVINVIIFISSKIFAWLPILWNKNLDKISKLQTDLLNCKQKPSKLQTDFLNCKQTYRIPVIIVMIKTEIVISYFLCARDMNTLAHKHTRTWTYNANLEIHLWTDAWLDNQSCFIPCFLDLFNPQYTCMLLCDKLLSIEFKKGLLFFLLLHTTPT